MVIITTYHLHLSGSTQQRLIYAQVSKDGDKGGNGVKRIHCQRRTVESMRKFVESSNFLPSDCQTGEKIVNPADLGRQSMKKTPET